MKVAMNKKETGVEFDPQKSYEWKLDTTIEISGAQYSLMRELAYNILKEERYQLATELYKQCSEILQENVEKGIFTEVKKVLEDGSEYVETEEVK